MENNQAWWIEKVSKVVFPVSKFFNFLDAEKIFCVNQTFIITRFLKNSGHKISI